MTNELKIHGMLKEHFVWRREPQPLRRPKRSVSFLIGAVAGIVFSFVGCISWRPMSPIPLLWCGKRPIRMEFCESMNFTILPGRVRRVSFLRSLMT